MKKRLTTVAHGLIASALLLAALTQPTAAAEPPPEGANKKTAAQKSVQLIVDYGDGVRKHFHRLPWQAKLTVLDATVAASKHPRGVRIKYRGKKATAFLSQIDELANNPSGKSWVYRVNGKLADRSFGIYPLAAGDIVTWSFQDYP